MSVVYNSGKQATWDWENDTFKMLMLQSSATLRADDDFISDVLSGNTECDFTNYARQTLTNNSITVDDTNDQAELDSDDITIADAGNGTNNTIGAVVVYFEVTNDTDSIPIVAYDTSQQTSGATLTVSWPAEGVVKVT